MKSAFNNAKYAHNGAHAHPDAVFIISLIVGIIFGILAFNLFDYKHCYWG